VTRSIDEAGAWALLRVLSRTPRTVGEAIHVQAPAGRESRLRVAPDGTWSTMPEPLPGARHLLDLFLPVALAPDIVVAQAGQSLDGRIATTTGHSHYVTGPEDLLRLHRLRALVDAVVVGVGTVVSDDPRLTVRGVEGENPVRVVLDPRGRTPPGAGVLTDGAAPTLILRGDGAFAPPSGPGVEAGVEVLPLPVRSAAGFDPADVLGLLRSRGLRRVLVEGGGITVSRFLQAGVLHRLHVTVAPLIIGSGRPAFTLDPVATLDRAIRPRCRHFTLGADVLFDLELDATPRDSARRPVHPGPREG
jgi:diaminohydroxyphosphoribosylaminopyrimidine deaminase / 5-amino-6-(5-phosphoribosylamino)uracil reductase